MKKPEKQPDDNVPKDSMRLWASLDEDDLVDFDSQWAELVEEEERKLRAGGENENRLAEAERQRPQLTLHSEKIIRQMQELEKQMAILMSLSDEALTLGDKKKSDGYKARIHELDKEWDKLKERRDVLTALIDEPSLELPNYSPSKNTPPNTVRKPPSQFLD